MEQFREEIETVEKMEEWEIDEKGVVRRGQQNIRGKSNNREKPRRNSKKI